MMPETNSTLADEQLNCGLSTGVRARLLHGLRALEDTVPPREVWQRISEQAHAEGLIRNPSVSRIKWLGGAGIAAAVVMTVLNVPLLSPTPTETSSTYTTPAVDTAVPHANATAEVQTLNALMVQSRQIESDLRALPMRPSVVRVSTAATLAELEDLIAAIDYRLNHPDMRLSPVEEAQYWRERVRLMNLLLNLRRAQAQQAAF
jgi:hypothetical protein